MTRENRESAMEQNEAGQGSTPADEMVEVAGFLSLDQGKDLAQRGYELLIRVATKASGIAFALFVAATAICGTAFILGIFALSGGVRTVWLVLGGLVVLVGAGASFRSWRSLSSITEQAAGIHESFQQLVSNLSATNDLRSLKEADIEEMGVVRQARLTRQIRKTVKDSMGEFKDLSAAFASVGSFPSVVFAAAVAIGISIVCGAIFLIMLLF